MKFQLFIVFLCLSNILAQTYYTNGEIDISNETLLLTDGTDDYYYFYYGQSLWGSAAATATAGTDSAQKFTYVSTAAVPTFTPNTGILKYKDIIDLTVGTTTRSFKNGPFVLFKLADNTNAYSCTATEADALDFRIKFFCNDTDAEAFYNLSPTTSIMINSVNTVTHDITYTNSIKASQILIGEVVAC